MSQLVVRVLAMIGLLFALAAPPANAQEPPMRVRGTIDRVDGDVYVVKARGGTELKVKLAEKAMVVALIKASLADIKEGSYVGVSGMPQADGSQGRSRCTSSQRQCAASVTDIAVGTCSRRAP
jgi:hypothetical protein